MTQAPVRSSTSSHPYAVKSIDQLPPSLMNLIKKQFLVDQSIEGIFVIPDQPVFPGWRGSAVPLQALIFTRDGVLHVTEPSSRRGEDNVQWVPAEGIISIKLSIILLYGLLEIWFFDLGKLSKLEVEFNTVGYPILGPMLRGLVRKTWKFNRRDMTELPRDKTFDKLEAISFSFYNGLRIEALQAEEKLLGHIFQREIKVPWLRFFRRSIAPQTAIAVTDKQIILLQQDLKFTKHHEEWIFTFCPLYRVVEVKEEPFNQWQKISFQLLPFTQPKIEVLLENKNIKEWRGIWDKLSINKT
jgi:hypothetical protein